MSVTMNFIFWNVRGPNGTDKHRDLKEFLNIHKPLLLCLIDTKLDESSIPAMQRKLGSYPCYYLSPESRICLLWHSDQLDIQIIAATQQFVHCTILCKQSHKRFLVTAVYASNSSVERINLWDSIKQLSSTIGHLGWIVGGDFNEVRFSNEKVGGLPIHSRRVRKFNSCVLLSGLDDLKAIGHTLSWCNRQSNQIMCRLDRVMGNQNFINEYPHSIVEYLPPGISDHSPLKVIFEPSIPSGPRPFKYFESWEAHPSFNSTVCEAWSLHVAGNPMYQFSKKLYNTKLALKRWNRDEYGPLHHQLATCKRELNSIQTALQLNPTDHQFRNQEKVMRVQYTSLLDQEEKFARQKSCQLWLDARDSNTKIFYNSIKSRTVRNSICRLRNTDDDIFCVYDGSTWIMSIRNPVDERQLKS
ncbi:hypothetical protein QJS10_CPB12g01029 [Acorus calamus]|uniref:Endonuclease/exonuclease/phosphatase domain-containing protein n=1 Tax=Acorus calamus TaxID=4465 RepID=A0AAV9DPE4_ACOCL|nr:hypothetical protein QJS10_CPB12g01029 [Acorus calamus]